MKEVCLKKVVVGGCTSRLPLSSIIRFFQKRFPFGKKHDRQIPSHSWAAGYSEELGCVVVLESSWYGYRPTEWSRWIKKKGKVIHAHHSTTTDMNRAIKWAGKKLGSSYDYIALFTYLFKYIWFLLSFKWVRHPFNTPRAMHCSEAKTRFLQQEGYFLGLHAESVYPLQLWYMLDDNPDFIDVTQHVNDGTWWKEFQKHE